MTGVSTTHTGLLDVVAECRTCGWTAESRNALGLAAQHARRYGHEVSVEQTIGITYNRGASATQEEAT